MPSPCLYMQLQQPCAGCAQRPARGLGAAAHQGQDKVKTGWSHRGSREQPGLTSRPLTATGWKDHTVFSDARKGCSSADSEELGMDANSLFTMTAAGPAHTSCSSCSHSATWCRWAHGIQVRGLCHALVRGVVHTTRSTQFSRANTTAAVRRQAQRPSSTHVCYLWPKDEQHAARDLRPPARLPQVQGGAHALAALAARLEGGGGRLVRKDHSDLRAQPGRQANGDALAQLCHAARALWRRGSWVLCAVREVQGCTSSKHPASTLVCPPARGLACCGQVHADAVLARSLAAEPLAAGRLGNDHRPQLHHARLQRVLNLCAGRIAGGLAWV